MVLETHTSIVKGNPQGSKDLARSLSLMFDPGQECTVTIQAISSSCQLSTLHPENNT